MAILVWYRYSWLSFLTGANMEGNRKSAFEQLRHKNFCSIDDLKLKLRKVRDYSIFCTIVRKLTPSLQLYIKDLKTKREKILNDKREIALSEEDDLDFFKNFCQEFFGQYEEPWEEDEDLLKQIWEEIQLEGITFEFVWLICLLISPPSSARTRKWRTRASWKPFGTENHSSNHLSDLPETTCSPDEVTPSCLWMRIPVSNT